MKDNIDLTENRMFRKHDIGISIRQIFQIHTFPWEFKGCKRVLSTLHENKTELVYTGDKKERQHKKQYEQYTHECECCGRDLSRIPWKNKYKLCEKCYSRLESDNNSTLFWRNKK